MAVLKNKTQKNFTMISNNILRDKELSMKDRGVLCTIFSLPDGWEFSVNGLSTLVPDGTDSLSASIRHLESLGYLARTKKRGANGRFTTEIEVFAQRRTVPDFPSRKNRDGSAGTVKPSRSNHDGSAVTENPAQYKTKNKKNNINMRDITSINLSSKQNVTDGMTDIQALKKIVADNIRLDWLLEAAEKHGTEEIQMVHEIYDLICNMVCFPRESVRISDTLYPWEVVKERFLKLKYDHISNVLNKILDPSFEIRNMTSYLLATLFNASLTGTIEAQADLYDERLYDYRGHPYE